MTMSFLMRLFAPRTCEYQRRVEAKQDELNRVCAESQAAFAETNKSEAKISHTIFATNISQEALGAAQGEYMKKERESGLHKGVSGNDAPVKK